MLVGEQSVTTELDDWQDHIAHHETLNRTVIRASLRPLRHAGLHEAHVRYLASVYEELPPVVVQRSSLCIVDGAHRLAAAELLGLDEVKVAYFSGADQEAYIEGLRLNVRQGLPFTLRDRTKAAANLVSLCSTWSDRRIAITCGVAPGTVGRIRATVQNEQLPRREGIDGRLRPADPKEARRHISQVLAVMPNAKTHELVAITGSAPATVRSARRGPIPIRLTSGQCPDRGTDLEAGPSPTEDAAFSCDARAQAFAAWFQAHLIEDSHWAGLIQAIPIGRVYTLADEARHQARCWERLAKQLELGATLRRSGPVSMAL
jgi:hypothetical protein